MLALGTASVSASSLDVDETLDELLGEGPMSDATLLAFWRESDRVDVHSVVRSKGQTRRRGRPVRVAFRETAWGSLEIMAPERDRELIASAMDIGEALESRWLDGAESSIGALLNMTKAGDIDSLHLKVIAVPLGVAYRYTERSSTAADPFSMAVMISVDPNAGKQAPDWYARMVAVTAHELLHLALFVNDTKPPSDHNEEAAASILEFCAAVLFARGVNANLQIDVRLNAGDDYLSSDTPPKYAPNRAIIEQGPATVIGDNISHAILLTEMGPQFQSNDAKADDILLPACAEFGEGRIPDFMSGATLDLSDADSE
jgi:hypothetical protein